jgi:hypothetical protein
LLTLGPPIALQAEMRELCGWLSPKEQKELDKLRSEGFGTWGKKSVLSLLQPNLSLLQILLTPRSLVSCAGRSRRS